MVTKITAHVPKTRTKLPKVYPRLSKHPNLYVSTQPNRASKRDPNSTYPILNRPFLPPPFMGIGMGWVNVGREKREATTEQCWAYFRLKQQHHLVSNMNIGICKAYANK